MGSWSIGPGSLNLQPRLTWISAWGTKPAGAVPRGSASRGLHSQRLPPQPAILSSTTRGPRTGAGMPANPLTGPWEGALGLGPPFCFVVIIKTALPIVLLG